MTLEQIVLYPLTHRMVTNDWYARASVAIEARTEHLRFLDAVAVDAPVKAKRSHTKKITLKVQS